MLTLAVCTVYTVKDVTKPRYTVEIKTETDRWKIYGGRLFPYRDLRGRIINRLWFCPFYWLEFYEDSDAAHFRDRLGNSSQMSRPYSRDINLVSHAISFAGQWCLQRDFWAEAWAKSLAKHSQIDGYSDEVMSLQVWTGSDPIDLAEERLAMSRLDRVTSDEIARLSLIGYWWVDDQTGDMVFNHSLSGFGDFISLIIKRFRPDGSMCGLLLPDQHDVIMAGNLDGALAVAEDWITSQSVTPERAAMLSLGQIKQDQDI